MLPLAFLSLKCVLTEQTYAGFLNDTFLHPAFILLYSPHCAQCQSVRAIWLDLMTKYASSPDLIVGDLDCFEHGMTCGAIQSDGGWPAFAAFSRGVSCAVRPAETLTGFVEQAEEIRRNAIALLCRSGALDFRGEVPALVMMARHTSRESACGVIGQLAAGDRRAADRMYFEAGAHRSFAARYGGGKAVEYDGDWTTESLGEFAQEYAREPLGNWKLEDGLKSARRLAMLVTQEPATVARFESIASDFVDDFLIGNITAVNFQRAYPYVRISGEAIVVFDMRKKKFAVYEKVDTEAEIRLILQRELEPETPAKWSRLALGIAVPAAVGVALAVGLACVLRGRVRKIE